MTAYGMTTEALLHMGSRIGCAHYGTPWLRTSTEWSQRSSSTSGLLPIFSHPNGVMARVLKPFEACSFTQDVICPPGRSAGRRVAQSCPDTTEPGTWNLPLMRRNPRGLLHRQTEQPPDADIGSQQNTHHRGHGHDQVVHRGPCAAGLGATTAHTTTTMTTTSACKRVRQTKHDRGRSGC
jgi:hypothetical protein